MADDQDKSQKTEDPTQKKLDDALERGDVAKSQEVNNWFILGAGLLALFSFGEQSAKGLGVMLAGVMGNAHQIPMDGGGLVRLTGTLGLQTLAICGIPFLLLTLAGIAGNLVQHQPLLTSEPLKPKLNRISPAAGFKRLFSKEALVNFAKGIAKITLLGALMAWLLWPERYRFDAIVDSDVTVMLPLVYTLALKLMAAVVAALAFIAALDFAYQKHSWREKQKMSLREIKDEFKQTDGDPLIKAKIRQLRQERAGKRMMAAVPEATVVITNPTHFAVALRYETGMPAPICVAKGVDRIALKIREIAAAHSVPVVENPLLARALYASVDIDQEIPAEHYKAVAAVIGYIMRLRRGLR